MRKLTTILSAGIVLFLGTISNLQSATAAEPAHTASYGARAAYVLHLLDGARYDEAVNAAGALVDANPNFATGYQLRGALFLLLGSPRRAASDFQMANSLAKNSPETLYGLALGALYTKRTAEAAQLLRRAKEAQAGGSDDAGDIMRALAYVLYLRGDAAGAKAQIPVNIRENDDPFIRELQAFLVIHTNHANAISLLTEMLKTANGVPRVREEAGIRALFNRSRPMECSVLEPSRRAFYLGRLMDRYAKAEAKSARGSVAEGIVTLKPRLVSETPAYRSFYIDGQFQAMVNTRPFSYEWDTRGTQNGRHTIRIDGDDAAGRPVCTESQIVTVRNASDTIVQTDPLTPTESDTIRIAFWKVMQIHASWKVAELAVARDASVHGNSGSASFHTAVAAALDPEYENGRAAMRSMLRSATPPIPPPVKGHRAGGWWQGPATGNMVALTFDDGPSRDKTGALLDALDKAHIPATFFVVGSRAELAPEMVARMRRRGDDVENHSYTHPDMSQSLPEVAEGEMLRASIVIRALTGRYPRFFRPPGGNRNTTLISLARTYGMSLAFWTVDGLGLEDSGSPKAVASWVLNKARPGSIILLHNGPEATTKAIPEIVAGLHARGYHIVTLETLVGRRR